MGNKSIKELLTGFYEGTLTEEQEKRLIDYFSTEIIDDELKVEKEIIMFFSSQMNIQVSESLESKLENIMQTNSRPKHRLRRWIAVGSVAACLLVIIGIGVTLTREKRYMPTAAEEEQIKMAQEKLIYVSLKFNKGLDGFSVMETQMNKVDKLLNYKK
ncbi:hypothetical protein LJC16_01870 [Bacteroidales bacterium OttesenSCG-928-C19]|nr:hypothetical protein [Bacteroidales bacterium OttesenSCG-928-C19]